MLGTSFWSCASPEIASIAFQVTRALVQALSNMVTANNDLISELWELYMGLPEEQVILMYGFLAHTKYVTGLMSGQSATCIP
jgi:hypothetical protein